MVEFIFLCGLEGFNLTPIQTFNLEIAKNTFIDCHEIIIISIQGVEISRVFIQFITKKRVDLDTF
jgi:hypothetical protein